MTLAEQRAKLIEAMMESMPDRFNLYFHDDELMEIYDAALIAISAAGFAIVGPEPSAAMIDAIQDDEAGCVEQFMQMLAAGDLARKPE